MKAMVRFFSVFKYAIQIIIIGLIGFTASLLIERGIILSSGGGTYDVVANNFIADAPEVTTNTFRVHITGVKVRQCRFIKGSERGFVRVDGVWTDQNVGFDFIIPPKSRYGASRPVGVGDFGIWEWRFEDMKRVEAVRSAVDHDCNGVTIVTPQGPFKVKHNE